MDLTSCLTPSQTESRGDAALLAGGTLGKAGINMIGIAQTVAMAAVAYSYISNGLIMLAPLGLQMTFEAHVTMIGT